MSQEFPQQTCRYQNRLSDAPDIPQTPQHYKYQLQKTVLQKLVLFQRLST